MNKSTKSILATIPLVMGLAGPASAVMADSSPANSAEVSSGAIDSLLNQYSGLTPGDPGNQNPTTQTVPPNQQLSSFTGAAGSMSSYFTPLGVDKTSANQLSRAVDYIASNSTTGNSGSETGAAASAPAMAAITTAHATQDSLVGAVASGSAPTTSSANTPPPIKVAGETPLVDVPLVPEPAPLSTPIPPAAVLISSGLAALATLKKRYRDLIPE